jgi:N-acetylglutamate synthase-like GNAT family acetyltransferase
MPTPISIKIGALKPAELPEADRIFRLAFSTFLGIPQEVSFMGDRDLVGSRFRGKHVKALAARENGRLIGTNFLTVWGAFAFFGPLTVLPEYWDKGVAQKLLAATAETFDKAKLPRTALFTFPHSAKHVGLYNKFGYWPQRLTALMHYTPSVETGPAPASGARSAFLSIQTRAAREEAISACRKLANRVDKGLDLTEEIRSLLKQRIGEVILTYTRNTLDGFAIACHGPGSEGGSQLCYVKFAAVRGEAGAGERFTSLLDAIDIYARAHGVPIEAGVNFACEDAYRRMRAHGYRAFTQGVPMQRPNAAGFLRTDAYTLSDLR